MEMPQNNIISKKMKLEIHCPVSGCLFAEGSERHFTAKKFLEQHIARIHAEKKYLCSKCQKGFGLDLFRKHHEKNCGIIWKCDCGTQYPSRESLLTHSRRTQHKLPDYAISEKKKQKKAAPVSSNNPVIFLIQPIIQNIMCTQQHQNFQPIQTPVVTPRRILPKVQQVSPLILPKTTMPATLIDSSPPVNFNPVQDGSFLTSNQPSSNSENTVQSLSINNYCTGKNNQTNSAKCQEASTTVSTQTIADTVVSSMNHRLSQASQCTRHRPKSMKIGIENQTQTAESAVVKIKKKRSRRKSVAITTETSIATDQVSDSNMFWPAFSDFVNSIELRMFKNCASTQTNTTKNISVCDSETLTDNELIKFAWEQTMKFENLVEKDNSHVMENDHLVSTSCDNNHDSSVFQQNEKNCKRTGNQSINNHNMEELVMFSQTDKDVMNRQVMDHNESVIDTNLEQSNLFSQKEKDLEIIKTNTSGNMQKLDLFSQNSFNPEHSCGIAASNDRSKLLASAASNAREGNCSIFSVFGSCDKPVTHNKDPHTSTLDIHTQTMASAVLDYNLLTNMETQTTDDFNFSYLEFSDTETQTPWEDLPTIDDSPLQADQLSIEIQTDFSAFGTAVNLDPFELISSVEVQNVAAGGQNKETANVNTETQTLDGFYFPQFTNSESQTLDICNFLFDS